MSYPQFPTDLRKEQRSQCKLKSCLDPSTPNYIKRAYIASGLEHGINGGEVRLSVRAKFSRVNGFGFRHNLNHNKVFSGVVY